MNYRQAFFLYTASLKVADALTVFAVWHLCWYLRFTSELIPVSKGTPEFSTYSEIGVPLALVFSVVFHVIGAYRSDRIHLGMRPLRKILQGSILGTLVFVAILYFSRDLNFSRVYLAMFPLIAASVLIIERLVLHLIWQSGESRFVRSFRTLVVGTGDLLNLYLHKITERKPYPIEWVGRLGSATESDILAGIPFLGTESDLIALVHQYNIDVVLVSYPTDQATRYESVLQDLSDELVTVKVLPDFGKYNTFTYAADHECGIPLLHFNQLRTGTTDLVLKRVFDLLVSVSLLLILAPLYGLIALLIRLTSKGPVLYSQERMGADGTSFTLYKFRSMHIDAEDRTGPVWATADDDRTTRVGRWLRRTSLDELPQLWNVARGDMSLVGPRPERPVFVDQFRKKIPKYMLRHKMKSGITGWAQINGWRGNTSLDERIKFDLYYIGHWSHYFDLKILCLTLWKGFVDRHAY